MNAGERRRRQQEALSKPESEQRARVLDVGPLRWAWGVGAWDQAGAWAEALGGPVLLCGEARWLKAWRKPLSQAFLERGIDTRLKALPDGVECCEEVVQVLVAEALECACVITVGGGKLMDLGKWTGFLAKRPVITLPTIAATCACASSVVVINSAQGEYLDVLDLECAPYGCAVDVDLIAAAPARTLAAGLADSLAKCFEWQALGLDDSQPGSRVAWELAQSVVARARLHGAKAIAGDPASQRVCLELNLVDSALISGLGDAPAAAAHSFVNALSVDPVAKRLLHGEAVGLGLLFQDQLCSRLGPPPSGDTAALRALLLAWGLPTGLPAGSLSDVASVFNKFWHPDETVHRLPGVEKLGATAIEEDLRSLLDRSNIET